MDIRIPFTPEQERALHRLAARCQLPVPIVIQRTVGEYLNVVAERGQPTQLRLPLSSELYRLARNVDEALDRFRSAQRKLAPPPLVATEPARVM